VLPSNSLLLGVGLPPTRRLRRKDAGNVLTERGRGPHPEGDVEQDVSRRGAPATPPRIVDDHANLLVARPGQGERLGYQAHPAVRLGDRDEPVVEPLDRCDEP
jgi:hypothetical protein